MVQSDAYHSFGRYPLSEVLRIAKHHPLYNKDINFPIARADVRQFLEQSKEDVNLSEFPICTKAALLPVIARLCDDRDPRNTFTHAAYFSTTGGGSGSGVPMPFVTDAQENRAQRRATGQLMAAIGTVHPGDVAISLHSCGHLYRALDLVCDLVEYAGGSPLAAGHDMPHALVATAAKQYHPNVLCGDPGQLVQFARHVQSMDDCPKFDRLIYTSEMLTRVQQAYLARVLGTPNQTLMFGSIYGSAETGTWAVSNSSMLASPFLGCRDFVFDSRSMLIELSRGSNLVLAEDDMKAYHEEGQPGRLILTSLQRLRHPLVRYDSGDIGSVHALPSPDTHLRVVRLHGRVSTESFEWHGEYFGIDSTTQFLENPALGILKWQIVLSDHDAQLGTHMLEVRILTADDGPASLAVLRTKIATYFMLMAQMDHLLRITKVELVDFERSMTGRKIIKVIDRRLKERGPEEISMI